MPKIPIESAADGETQSRIYSQQAKVLACDKCAGTKVAKSRAKSLDSLIMRVIPRRPYRCLHCYHRFWEWESFFANRQRVISWAILIGVVALIYVWLAISKSQQVDIGPFYQVDTSITSPEMLQQSLREARSNDAASAQQQRALEPSAEQVAKTPTRPVTRPSASAAPSAEELRRVRAEVEQVKRLNEQKRALLEQSMQEQRAELESLLKVEIGYLVENWRKAWQAGDVQRYLSYYSANFQPRANQDLAAWRAQRRARVSPSKNISLELNNFGVDFNQQLTRAVVSFDQNYQAGSFQELSRKQLVLLKEQQEWKIIAETEIN